MTALENQNAAFNELQKDATEKTQLVEKMKIELQHRKEFDRLSKNLINW